MLDRLDGMIQAMRAEKRRILRGSAQIGNIGMRPSPMNSPDHDCATPVMHAFHPAMNPYNMPANAGCRKTYAKDMCARSLKILNRTVMVATHPEHSEQEIADIVHNIGVAARVALGGLPLAEADLRRAAPVDAQKFDLEVDG